MQKITSIDTLKKLDQLNPKEFIIIKGARVNNLKNLDVAIPRNKLVVITGKRIPEFVVCVFHGFLNYS